MEFFKIFQNYLISISRVWQKNEKGNEGIIDNIHSFFDYDKKELE